MGIRLSFTRIGININPRIPNGDEIHYCTKEIVTTLLSNKTNRRKTVANYGYTIMNKHSEVSYACKMPQYYSRTDLEVDNSIFKLVQTSLFITMPICLNAANIRICEVENLLQTAVKPQLWLTN